MKLARFTVRDLSWLVLVVGLVCAWWLQYERLSRSNRALASDLVASRMETAVAQRRALTFILNDKAVKDQLREQGLHVSGSGMGTRIVENSGKVFDRSNPV